MQPPLTFLCSVCSNVCWSMSEMLRCSWSESCMFYGTAWIMKCGFQNIAAHKVWSVGVMSCIDLQTIPVVHALCVCSGDGLVLALWRHNGCDTVTLDRVVHACNISFLCGWGTVTASLPVFDSFLWLCGLWWIPCMHRLLLKQQEVFIR